MRNIKKEVKYCDWLIWISFGLMLLVKLFTIFLFLQISKVSGATITAVATNYEANQLFKLALDLNHIGMILSVIIIPASAMAVYFYLRRKLFMGKIDLDSLMFFVQFAFFALLINIVNDGAALLGTLWKVL